MRRVVVFVVAAVIVCGLAVLAARWLVLFKLEHAKVNVLSNLVRGSDSGHVNNALERYGRRVTGEEARALDFAGAPASPTAEVRHYWVEGGLMVRVTSDSGTVTAIDVRKIEYK